ncbi:hypothetical protein [Streptomyces apricus]|uniref:hypothetical protein n=1 Tax=Streptomyces apricus TaxID=1828112 RepID=UPI0038B442FF
MHLDDGRTGPPRVLAAVAVAAVEEFVRRQVEAQGDAHPRVHAGGDLRGPLRLPEPEALTRAFLDAVADALPRTPAAPYAAGLPFAASAPQRLPGALDWAAEVAAGMDAGVRISLRLDLSAYELRPRRAAVRP